MIKKKTKIIATIGPASSSDSKLEQMINGGMNITRLNLSHGDHASHGERIQQIRRIAENLNEHVGIMVDTKGPEIRLHDFEDKGVLFERNDVFKIMMDRVIGNHEAFSLTYSDLIYKIKENDIIKIDDGEFEARVIGINLEERFLLMKAINSHFVKSRKGVNIPNVHLDFDYISPADEKDLAFACQTDVDFIAASFVRSADDILKLRDVLKQHDHEKMLIIAKIENKDGIQNIDEILRVADGIMVARGDMGVEIDVSMVPFVQQQIIQKCRMVGKPVIVATQMLNSMQENLIPTRAEVSDVTLAITQGCDAVMLSGESASGKYPVESVKMQTRIAKTSEKYLDYVVLHNEAFASSSDTLNDAMMNSIASSAITYKAKVIVSFNRNGNATMRLAKGRAIAPILMMTDSVHVARRMSLIWGVKARVEKAISLKRLNLQQIDQLARKYALEEGYKEKDRIIVCGSIETDFDENLDVMRVLEL